MLVASSADKDSIHQASGAGWVEGYDMGAARFKWGLWACGRGERDWEEGEWVEKNVPICQVLPPTTPTFFNHS